MVRPADRAIAPRPNVVPAAPAVPELDRAVVDQIATRAEKMLVDFAKERSGIGGTGQDNGGSGNVEINERRGAISVLMSRLSPKALAKVLGKDPTLKNDVAWLER